MTRVGRPRGDRPRHVVRREAQIARGLRPKTEWRIYSINIRKGSEVDKRLQGMRKGDVSGYVRLCLNDIHVEDRLRVGDVRSMGEYRCVWTEDGWRVIE